MYRFKQDCNDINEMQCLDFIWILIKTKLKNKII